MRHFTMNQKKMPGNRKPFTLTYFCLLKLYNIIQQHSCFIVKYNLICAKARACMCMKTVTTVIEDHSLVIRRRIPGMDIILPAISCEAMYSPEDNARTASGKATVE